MCSDGFVGTSGIVLVQFRRIRAVTDIDSGRDFPLALTCGVRVFGDEDGVGYGVAFTTRLSCLTAEPDMPLGVRGEALRSSAKGGEEVAMVDESGDCVAGLVSRLETNSSALILLDIPEETLIFFAMSAEACCDLETFMYDPDIDRLEL